MRVATRDDVIDTPMDGTTNDQRVWPLARNPCTDDAVATATNAPLSVVGITRGDNSDAGSAEPFKLVDHSGLSVTAVRVDSVTPGGNESGERPLCCSL